MGVFIVLRGYIVWHYSVALSDMVHIWVNMMWYINHLFSVPDVAMSLFAPFRRLEEKQGNIMTDPGDFFAGLVVNLIMRLVGMAIRLGILIVACALFLVVIAIGVAMFIVWPFLPLIVGAAIPYSLGALFG